jgi:hypothetical protein
MILKIKIDEKGLKQIKSVIGMKMLGSGTDSLSVPEILWLALIEKEEYRTGKKTMDLTEKAGKLARCLDRYS